MQAPVNVLPTALLLVYAQIHLTQLTAFGARCVTIFAPEALSLWLSCAACPSGVRKTPRKFSFPLWNPSFHSEPPTLVKVLAAMLVVRTRLLLLPTNQKQTRSCGYALWPRSTRWRVCQRESDIDKHIFFMHLSFFFPMLYLLCLYESKLNCGSEFVLVCILPPRCRFRSFDLKFALLIPSPMPPNTRHRSRHPDNNHQFDIHAGFVRRSALQLYRSRARVCGGVQGRRRLRC